jgi:hypothetical protein
MRYLAVNAAILGATLAAVPPAGAQSMVDLNAAMGVNSSLERAAGGSATTALRSRETIVSHTSSGGGVRGWSDAGDGHMSGAGGTKGWATPSSGSSGGKSAWASRSSNSTGGGTKGWATAGAGKGSGKAAWASKKDAGGGSARVSASPRGSAPSRRGSTTSPGPAYGSNGPSARDLATSKRSSR